LCLLQHCSTQLHAVQGVLVSTHCLSVDCVERAQDPLELEEAHVMQQLATKLPDEYDILSK